MQSENFRVNFRVKRREDDECTSPATTGRTRADWTGALGRFLSSLFLIGVAIPFVLYTVWGLMDIGSTPLAEPVAISAQAPAPPPAAAAITVNASMAEYEIEIPKFSSKTQVSLRLN